MRKRDAGMFAAGVLTAVLVPLVVLAFGWTSFAASESPSGLERALAPWARERSIARHAGTLPAPLPTDAAALATGLDHYRENCVACHGAPGVPGAELSKGLNPPAPSLDQPRTQRRSDSILYWIVKNGIRMTGMPAFGPTHDDAELLKIVALVRHLPNLTETEAQQLRAATKQQAHHHDRAIPAPSEPVKPHSHVHPH